MRAFLTAVLATSLIASSALVEDAGALAPGKPAGVKQAQMTDNEMYIALGVAAVAGGIIAAATSQHHHEAPVGGTTTTTTTTTGTSP